MVCGIDRVTFTLILIGSQTARSVDVAREIQERNAALRHAELRASIRGALAMAKKNVSTVAWNSAAVFAHTSTVTARAVLPDRPQCGWLMLVGDAHTRQVAEAIVQNLRRASGFTALLSVRGRSVGATIAARGEGDAAHARSGWTIDVVARVADACVRISMRTMAWEHPNKAEARRSVFRRRRNGGRSQLQLLTFAATGGSDKHKLLSLAPKPELLWVSHGRWAARSSPVESAGSLSPDARCSHLFAPFLAVFNVARTRAIDLVWQQSVLAPPSPPAPRTLAQRLSNATMRLSDRSDANNAASSNEKCVRALAQLHGIALADLRDENRVAPEAAARAVIAEWADHARGEASKELLETLVNFR